MTLTHLNMMVMTMLKGAIVTTHYNLIDWCFHEGGFHVRVCGYGVNVINREMYPPLYSRRQKKVIKVGAYDIFKMSPCKPFKIDLKI